MHWLNLQPANLAQEPDAYPDLTVAIALSSLLGRGHPGDAPTRSDRATPLSWEKALREAPASASDLVRVGDHIGVRVTFPARSFGRVARLIRMRSRRSKLERITEHFAEVRLARNQRLAQTPHLELIRRALDAADPDHKPGTRLLRGSAEHLSEKTAMAFYRWSHHPQRAINIIVGGFDLEFTKNVLNVVFREKVEDAPMPESKKVDAKPIRSEHAAIGDTLIVVCPLPAEPILGLDLLIELIASGDDAFLPDYLRAAGHPNILVQCNQMSTASGRVLLIQVTSLGLRLDTRQALTTRVKAALAQLIEKPAAEMQVQRAISALRARRTAKLARQEGLAEFLARRWMDSGVPSPRLDTSGRMLHHDDLSAVSLQSLAATILAPATRTILVEETKK